MWTDKWTSYVVAQHSLGVWQFFVDVRVLRFAHAEARPDNTGWLPNTARSLWDAFRRMFRRALPSLEWHAIAHTKLRQSETHTLPAPYDTNWTLPLAEFISDYRSSICTWQALQLRSHTWRDKPTSQAIAQHLHQVWQFLTTYRW